QRRLPAAGGAGDEVEAVAEQAAVQDRVQPGHAGRDLLVGTVLVGAHDAVSTLARALAPTAAPCPERLGVTAVPPPSTSIKGDPRPATRRLRARPQALAHARGAVRGAVHG